MSVKVMGLVWDLTEVSREEKYILLAYADHADHDGGSIFPKVSTIAKKTGYSNRSVQRITRKLETSGYLVPEGGQKGGVGITPHWRIPMKDDRIAPLPKGDNNGSERVTPATPKGDTTMSPDSSLSVINLNDIKELGGVGFYIYSFFGYDYGEAVAKEKAGIDQLVQLWGEEKICVMADYYHEQQPELDLRQLLKKIVDNVDYFDSVYIKDKNETPKEINY